MNQHVNHAKFRTNIYNLHGALTNLRLRLARFLEFCDCKVARIKFYVDLSLALDWVFDTNVAKLIKHVVHYTYQFDPLVLQHFCAHKYFNCTIDNPDHSEMADECYTYYNDMRTALRHATYHPNFNLDKEYKGKIETVTIIFGKLQYFYSDLLSGYSTCGIPHFSPRGALTKPAVYHEQCIN